MTKRLLASLSIALIVGVTLTYVLMLCWGYIAAHSPVLKWLLGLGLRGRALRAILYPIDFLTTVVLSLPAAVLLLKLSPPKLALFLTVAVVPSFILINYHLPGSPYFQEMWSSFFFGWVQELMALPAGAYLLCWMMKPSPPDDVLRNDG
jgi:hypothetical protein